MLLLSESPAGAAPPNGHVTAITVIAADGGRVDWSHTIDRVAFDAKGDDGYFDVYLMSGNGKEVVSLTDGNPLAGHLHNGNPAWHPSGEYLVFQSEKTERHWGLGVPWDFVYASQPGVGINNDLWLITVDGRHVWRLTDQPTATLPWQTFHAVLNPHFSDSGRKLVWTERIGGGGNWGTWVIHVADFTFAFDDEKPDASVPPVLSNVRTIAAPSNFWESHGFLPGSETHLTFAGNVDGQHEYGSDVGVIDLAECAPAATDGVEKCAHVNLTATPEEWDEAVQVTPDGGEIAWMSSNGYGIRASDPAWWTWLQTEYWVMNTDGSDKTQLTYFNKPGHPHNEIFSGRRVNAADLSFSSDGSSFVGVVSVGGGDTDRAAVGGTQLSIVRIDLASSI